LNRRSIENLARRLFAAARRLQAPLSLLLIDLDHFKSINDIYGHDEGDAVLRAFARVTGAALRAGEPLGRFGGEEFLVVLPGAAGTEALQAAERLRALVAHEVAVGAGRERPVTISIGVAEALSDDADVEALIRRADAALYEAKAHGRNRVVALGDLARAAGG
jgi:diguanylate cyclase (GGDEF)-like protein